jgi:transposase
MGGWYELPGGGWSFGVSVLSAIRLRQLALEHGLPVAKPLGGDRHPARIEAHCSFLRDLMTEQTDMTLVEIQARLNERGASVGIARYIFFARHGITWKKYGTRSSKTAPTS